jgi:hypothetical protein
MESGTYFIDGSMEMIQCSMKKVLYLADKLYLQVMGILFSSFYLQIVFGTDLVDC